MSVSKKRDEKLRGLYDLGHRKEKMAPKHQLLGTKDELASVETKKFRSALGTLLYMAQDHWDLQRSAKCVGFIHGQAYRDGSEVPTADAAVCEAN